MQIEEYLKSREGMRWRVVDTFKTLDLIKALQERWRLDAYAYGDMAVDLDRKRFAREKMARAKPEPAPEGDWV